MEGDSEQNLATRIPVSISALRLVNFKGYEDETFEFNGGLNFITGVNGSGKTNLLDAIHYTCITKSFLYRHDRYNIREGADFMRIEADISLAGESNQVEVKFKPGEIKEFRVNGEHTEKLSAHIGRYPVIVLSPKDQILIEGARNERRRFLDFYLSQVSRDYLFHLAAYNRVLNQRNAHLKQYGARSDKDLLLAYSRRMNEHAANIIPERRDFIDSIGPYVSQQCESLSLDRDHVMLAYKPDAGGDADLGKIATETLDRDMLLQRTTRGPHRDDLHFEIDEHALKRFGSQGQMKTYLVALHLALHDFVCRVTGKVPIILLDDIFDKLDDNRTLKLVQLLEKIQFGQVFITDAREERIAAVCQGLHRAATIFTIRDGRLASVSNETIQNGQK